MAKTTVTVHCKLPHGLWIEHPKKTGDRKLLNGAFKATIVGSGYGITEIDADFWQAWAFTHKDYPALKNGSIYAANNAADAQAMSIEHENIKTGLEPMPKNVLGVEPLKV